MSRARAVRRPAVHAGSWYPTDERAVRAYVPASRDRTAARAIIVPHAGWVYSGHVAGAVFAAIAPAARYILIGPNHRGAGAAIGVYPGDFWETPLGDLAVDRDLSRTITDGLILPDAAPHEREHSLEVIMPFIKATAPDAAIVAVSMRDYAPAACRGLGERIASALASGSNSDDTVLIASTDMTHFEPADRARSQDALAMERIAARDPDGLLRTVAARGISMCGAGPVAAVLWAANALGAGTPRLVRYAHSGEVTGDHDAVVAYAGFIVPRSDERN